MKKNFNLFFDMDDTLLNFDGPKHKNVSKAISRKGFFAKLKPLPFLNEINMLASICPENIFIVSACADTEYCIPEKIETLKKYFKNADKENVIFMQIGCNKADAVERFLKRKLNKFDILIDDYSKNLTEWEERGGTSIKFKNKYNTSDPSKYSHIVSNFSELTEVLSDMRKHS